MPTLSNRIRGFTTGVVLTLAVVTPALADDSEIYSSQAPQTGALPNVLFIMDTSGSMDTEVEQSMPAFKPGTTYSGTCSDNYIYYVKGGDTPPDCSDDSNRVPRSWFVCDAASTALGAGGSGTYPGLGNTRVRAAQIRKDGNKYSWQQLEFRQDRYVDCEDDDGKHGVKTGDGLTYIRNGMSNTTDGWTATTNSLWPTLGSRYRFFSANYVNYYYGSKPEPVTRLQIVRDVALNLAGSLQGVNLGLMRYSTDAEGGYVIAPIKKIDDNRADVIKALESFDPKDGSGGTPLSETLYEAALYMTGGAVDYGSRSTPGKSTDTTAVSGANYVSPIEYSCQKNYIVYLTDGAPTVDTSANEKIPTMIGKTACAKDTAEPFHDGGWVEGSGACLDDLAGWMANENTDLGKGPAEKQNALTYMIGFGNSLADSVGYLDMVAKAGGTDKAYTAADVATLTNALQQIFSNIQEDSGTFVTPSISVNAFNRSQTDQDLYFSLFKASNRAHWPGNLKKYKLATKTVKDANGKDQKVDVIVDVNKAEAVTTDGKFSTEATSFWSPVKDGADVQAGGAASKQDPPASRVLYTSLGTAALKGDNKNLIATPTNTLLTDAIVGTGTDTAACSLACQTAISWLRGVDTNDDNKDGKVDDYHKFMGDPLHGKPAVVTYGKLSDGSPDTVVFLPTNDGLLHAINGADSDGTERWAWMPPELLSRIGPLSKKDSVTGRTYGLDGDIRVLRLDKDQDGVVDIGDDRIWLFFGMRAGGNRYYALDVTKRDEPKLLWNIGPGQLPQVGQTWSAPEIARVNVKSGNDDAEKFVLIFGGGYDTKQEAQPYSTDIVGNRIFMVDASTGDLLWFAGGSFNSDTTTPDLKLDATGKVMDNSIPSRITVIDTNGDLFADRMYVGDMGGRVWRFDITNGNDKTTLVAGGIIAKLGNGSNATQTDADNRRFYNAPDVALIQVRGQEPYYNVAIGSGYRGHPLNLVTQERFYSVRDALPFAMLTQTQYDAIVPIENKDLVDVTPTNSTVTKTDKGWRLDMYAAAKWAGEKVLSESITADNKILFTTFEPENLAAKKGACYPATTNRAYAASVFTGKPVLDFNGDGVVDEKDRSTDLNQEGIVGDINIALKRSATDDPNTPPDAPPTVCLAGMQVLKKCVNVGGTVRTWWNRNDAK